MIRRPNRKYNLNPSRRKVLAGSAANNLGTRTVIVPTVGAISGSTLPITFPEPIIYAGVLPKWTTTTRTVVGVAVTSPTTVTLTFSGALTGTSPLTIPFQDLAFRNSVGGYVQSGSYAIA